MGLEEARGPTLSCRSHGVKFMCPPWDLQCFEPTFSFVKWRYNCLANVRAPFLVTEGSLEEVTETPFGWEEGKLDKRGTALQGRRLMGGSQGWQGGESP